MKKENVKKKAFYNKTFAFYRIRTSDLEIKSVHRDEVSLQNTGEKTTNQQLYIVN